MGEHTPRSRTPLRITLAVVAVLVLCLALLQWTGRLDREPPRVTWSPTALASTQSGTLRIVVGARDDRPGLGSLTLAIDGVEVSDLLDGHPLQLDPGAGQGVDLDLSGSSVYGVDVVTSAFADGPHTLTIGAADRGWPRNRTEIAWTLVFDNTAPTLTAPAGPLAARQGSVAVATIEADETLASATATIDDRTVALYALEDRRHWRLLAGIGVEEGADGLLATIEARDMAGNSSTVELPIAVEQVDWPRGGYIALNPTQEQALKDETTQHDANDRRRAAYALVEPRQQWNGTFTRPAAGAVTSPFGKFRQYSTGARRHHLGIDIANVLGTPIVAAAPGVVTLAEKLAIYGNAVIVNHGHGVSTSYNHLRTIDVAVGDHVDQGQPIGTMGSTGQSTGSHLHWGMVVGGLAVDPLEWTRDVPSEP